MGLECWQGMMEGGIHGTMCGVQYFMCWEAACYAVWEGGPYGMVQCSVVRHLAIGPGAPATQKLDSFASILQLFHWLHCETGYLQISSVYLNAS